MSGGFNGLRPWEIGRLTVRQLICMQFEQPPGSVMDEDDWAEFAARREAEEKAWEE